jgi:serralysin
MADIPGDATTTTGLAPGGSLHDSIEAAGDRDWIAVTLVAGEAYDILVRGAGASPLDDPFLRIYDEAGNLVALDDDSGPGLAAALTGFTATHTGVFYLEVSASLDAGAGDYRVKLDLVPKPGFLQSIDWGTEVPRNVVNVYFAAAGEVFDGRASLGWNAYEIAQSMLAFEQISNVCGLDFNIVTDAASADFRLITIKSDRFLGYFWPPGTREEGVGAFVRNGFGWDQGAPGTGGLEQGGYGFITLIHEFGHGVGLAHPHDEGGRSTIWEGVESPFDDYGKFDLNQGIYTTMSYNDGWRLQPGGANGAVAYGWQGTMMAFDIALLQAKYGADMSYRTGDDTYVLPEANGVGTYFACLWDAGGTDSITYGGRAAAVIDLRAAHLGYGPGSGGYISFADGVFGGFTIANGVVIENAAGGAGRDTITGNGADNSLSGAAGADDIAGGDGDDAIRGGGGRDRIEGGAGQDLLSGGTGNDSFVFATAGDSGAGWAASDRITDFGTGRDVIDLSGIDAVAGGGDDAFAWIGAAGFSGTAGELRGSVRGGSFVLEADLDGDGGADLAIRLAGLGAVAAGDLIL